MGKRRGEGEVMALTGGVRGRAERETIVIERSHQRGYLLYRVIGTNWETADGRDWMEHRRNVSEQMGDFLMR